MGRGRGGCPTRTSTGPERCSSGARTASQRKGLPINGRGQGHAVDADAVEGQPSKRAVEGDGEEEAGRYPMSKPKFRIPRCPEPDRAATRAVSVETLLDAWPMHWWPPTSAVPTPPRRRWSPSTPNRVSPCLRTGARRGRHVIASRTTPPTTSVGSRPRRPSRSSCSGSHEVERDLEYEEYAGARVTS